MQNETEQVKTQDDCVEQRTKIAIQPDEMIYKCVESMTKQLEEKNKIIEGYKAIIVSKEQTIDGLVNQMYELRNKYDAQKVLARENIQAIINELHEVKEGFEPT